MSRVQNLYGNDSLSSLDVKKSRLENMARADFKFHDMNDRCVYKLQTLCKWE